ncbi:Uncharacterised protein [Salmonella enterica subsp. enterica serovar Heidelberg]|nr:Uncharacterised protein [Salmonella enterica subsp. enterica serovar Heidelberg]
MTWARFCYDDASYDEISWRRWYVFGVEAEEERLVFEVFFTFFLLVLLIFFVVLFFLSAVFVT